MDERPPKIVCRNLWKLYGVGAAGFLNDRPVPPTLDELKDAGLIGAVRDASFDVGQGENFVIMGLSGSGKSTLVRCLTRLIEPTQGAVLVDGTDLLQASDRELIDIRRHRMGMVFQHFALLPHLNVLGNVAFPLEAQGVARRVREERAMEVIELVGLSGREHYFPRELSGGQQQRVGIARALAVQPEILFLDEPFSALDPLIRREMQDEFLRLQARLHKTIVFITHDFDEAIRLADRIAIMKDGRIVQIGTPEELVLDPADPYVAEFTQYIPHAKVLSAGAVMAPADAGRTYGTTVPAAARVEQVGRAVLDARGPVGVVDADGSVIGELTRERLLDVLVRREPAPV